MKRPPLPYLLLLPLLAVLVFGNCGGGVNTVNNFIYNFSGERRARLESIIQHRLQLRTQARKHLRGAARQDEFWRIEQATNARMDSLFGHDAGRFYHRRNKIERRLRKHPLYSDSPHHSK